ncbi:MAG: DUF2905 domain-containing protein [Elusimicrobia bacterium]|nr:DUF2905 domain-containing protein [Elusimicrobiota bacterium]
MGNNFLIGKTFIYLGIVFLLSGLVVIFFPKIPMLGNLPGDIKIDKETFKFYFPFTTSILLSLVLSFLYWLISKS